MDTKLNDLVERSMHYRGVILHKCIILEQEIEDIIIKYFVSDFGKHIDMHEIIIDRMTFDGKIAAFEELLKRNISPEDQFDKVYGKLFSELRYLKDIRNKFAHYNIDMSFSRKQKMPKEFSLISYRNGAKAKVFSKGDFDQFNTRIAKCIEELIKLNP